MGHLPHPDDHARTFVLVGADRGFWEVFKTSAEFRDGQPYPIDRWSKRILNPLAAEAIFPSDGPPYAPFIAWARASGRFWQSPTGMLVHDHAGMMVSVRGALVLNLHLPKTDAIASPCISCVGQPCITACPIGALSDVRPYDVPACKDFINNDAGAACMSRGCATRTACPISQAFDRPDAQTAFHMHAFRGN